jgi:hypothetical protein
MNGPLVLSNQRQTRSKLVCLGEYRDPGGRVSNHRWAVVHLTWAVCNLNLSHTVTDRVGLSKDMEKYDVHNDCCRLSLTLWG